MKCPTCKKETPYQRNPYRPFCSERCKLIDLGKWASGVYRLPSEEKAGKALDGGETEATGDGEEEDDENR